MICPVCGDNECKSLNVTVKSTLYVWLFALPVWLLCVKGIMVFTVALFGQGLGDSIAFAVGFGGVFAEFIMRYEYYGQRYKCLKCKKEFNVG